MISEISNGKLTCRIEHKGAQLAGLEMDGRQYVWNADPAFWKWHAPVLFPFCGNFPQGFEVDGKTFHLPQHGFLRDVEHAQIADGVFEFSSEGTDNYPFAFRTLTSFILEDNTLIHSLDITNTGDRPLPCSYGFHTGLALNQPVLEFEHYEHELESSIFKADDQSLSKTILMTDVSSRRIMCTDNDGRKVLFESPDFTTLVIWSAPGCSCRFICIEPRVDTIPTGATEPFARSIAPGSTAHLEERYTILS